MVHGALDWMFPIAMAREAERALITAGAAVTYREIPDLAHTYPRELNPHIRLAWMNETAVKGLSGTPICPRRPTHLKR